jgi:ABC-type transport system involved in multi-copper enzyme maturation permease subunit
MISLVIARNTFREATRDRILAGVVAGGVLLLASTQALGPLAMGEGLRLTVDMGLSAIQVLGLLVILLVGTNLVAKELERRTIYNLLSRPIPRWAYLLGKWAGLTAALWGVSALLGLALALLLAIRGAPDLAAVLPGAVYATGLELSVMTAIAVLFSAFSTPALSALLTLGFYVLGQWTYDLREFAGQFTPALSAMVQWIANVLPNLPIFNMRTLAAMGETATSAHLAIATVYALVYISCILALATAVFERRDFK